MKGLQLLNHLLSLKCKLVNAKTVGRGTTTIESKSWTGHSVDFGFFTSVIYKDIHARVFTLWGYHTFISKTSLKRSKTNTLCWNASRSLSFTYFMLIFSHKLLFSSLLKSTLTYIHQALQEAPYLNPNIQKLYCWYLNLIYNLHKERKMAVSIYTTWYGFAKNI